MDPIARARVALEGLSVGDAFGEQSFARNPMLGRATPSAKQWPWTDDTAMAMSIVDVLAARGAIDPDELAAAFARRYTAEPARGYGAGAHKVLSAIAGGERYDIAAKALFRGEGSCGNGGGMRSAPVGAYFADALDVCVTNAAASAAPTHAHPDGVAGAVAIAVAAAVVAAGERDARAILDAVVARTPAGRTHDGLVRVRTLLRADHVTVASEVGNGSRVLASDTVPFAVWCAATHVTDYAEALWSCVEVGGDVDTTCAMVGGIVVGAVGVGGIPADWRAAREPV